MLSMKRILLIAPFNGIEHTNILSKFFKEKQYNAPPLGLHQIASYLIKHNHYVDVVSPNIDYDKLTEYLSRNTYDFVGFSMLHETLENDLSLVIKAKKHLPDAVFVAGGIEVTFNPDFAFKHSPIDVIVLGEGEKTMLQLVETPQKDYHLIPGLYLRSKDEYYRTGYRKSYGEDEFREMSMGIDISNIPYRHYWDNLKSCYNNITEKKLQEIYTIRLYTTNHCPLKCSFCSSTQFRDYSQGGTTPLVYLDAKDIMKLIYRAIEAYPEVRTIYFNDDEFNLNQKRTKDLCELLIAAKDSGNIPEYLTFICSVRISNLKEEMLLVMESAGFRVLGLGVESFSQKQLDEFSKKLKVSSIEETLSLILKTTITPFVNIILTSSSTTMHDVTITIECAIEYLLKGVQINLNLYTIPLAGSTITKENNINIAYRSIKLMSGKQVLQKPERIIPKDPEVRSLLESFESIIMKKRNELTQKYDISHISSTINSALCLLCLAELMNLDTKQAKLLEYIETFS